MEHLQYVYQVNTYYLNMSPIKDEQSQLDMNCLYPLKLKSRNCDDMHFSDHLVTMVARNLLGPIFLAIFPGLQGNADFKLVNMVTLEMINLIQGKIWLGDLKI